MDNMTQCATLFYNEEVESYCIPEDREVLKKVVSSLIDQNLEFEVCFA